MNEIEKVYRTLLEWKGASRRMALATVVSIQGSAYRRPGARMLVSEQGESIGMIGGGCFDAAVKEIGFQVIRTGNPELHLYHMAGADPWDLGMGCTGSVYVLVESLQQPSGIEWIKEVGNVLEKGGNLIIGHQFSKPIDYRSAVGNGEVQIDRRYRRLSARIQADTAGLADFGSFAFLEKIEPAPRLVVFGAGNDAIPLVNFASNAGFRVTIVDQREDLQNRQRFLHAAEFIQAWPDDFTKKITPSPGDFVVIMSHRLENDAEAFRVYCSAQPAYIGFLGPKSRTERIFHEIAKIDPSDLNAIQNIIHAPIGLDLGAETAEEVAISIVAELLAVKNRRAAKFLRDKQGGIHSGNSQSARVMTDSSKDAAGARVHSCGI